MKKRVFLFRQSAIALLCSLFTGITWGQSGAFITRWSTEDMIEIDDFPFGSYLSPSAPFITIPTVGGGYNYNITWTNISNPGVMEGSQSNINGDFTITGIEWGSIYEVAITGTFPRFYMGGHTTINHKLISIRQWGNINWSSMEDAFTGCINMSLEALDTPNLSNVSSLRRMFKDCSSMVGNTAINNWNTSSITNMNAMFFACTVFNQSLNSWNVSNVQNFEAMFSNCSFFNQAIDSWDVSSATNMKNMFFGAHQFNQPIGNWDVSNVTDMSGMFQQPSFSGSNFNQPIGSWDVSNVTNMMGMFSHANQFNQPIGNWDVSNVTNTGLMFQNAYAFNQPIGNWDVSNVTQMSGMFSYANQFNQPIGNWNVSNVIDFINMFGSAVSFNQNLGSWLLSNNANVTFMLNNSGMDCENYSETLFGWANNPLTPNNRILGASGRTYGSDAAAARTILTGTKGWSISGDIAGTNSCLSQSTPCSTNYGTDVQQACGSFTWIDGNTYNLSNNSAQFTLTNAGGCDSVVSLNLTIWNCITLNNSSCGATNVSMNQLINAQNIGAMQYRFRITGNNSQNWPNNEFIYTSNSKNFRFQFIPGAMWGETYGVEVAYSTAPGVFGPYGASCDVTLQSLASLPLPSVQAAVCGATVEMNASISTPWVPGALGYRYQIVGNNSAMWPLNTVVIVRPASPRQFRFIDVAGSMFGETYAVSVAFQDGSGNWSAYGAPCNITIVSGITQLDLASCGATNVLPSDFLLADNVIGAAGYRFRITGANSAGWPMGQIEVDRNNRVFWVNLANGWLPGETYTIEVAVQDAAGNYGAYGPSCSVTMAGTPLMEIVNVDAAAQTKATIEGAFGATASHNPFTRDFALNMVNANDTDAINVAIYDMSGKLIEASSVNPMDIESARFGANLATGMYMIQVTQGANQAVIRQVKN